MTDRLNTKSSKSEFIFVDGEHLEGEGHGHGHGGAD